MPTASIADRCRRHREEMTLALHLGVTPAEARAELDREAARKRWHDTEARLTAKMSAGPTPRAINGASAEPRQPWWRD